MSRAASIVLRQRSHLFKIQYALEYKSFVLNQVLINRQHPLHELKKKKQKEKKQIGLWWFITSPADLSRSSCVRTWARRRLREAVIEELKVRGYDDNGLPLKGQNTTQLKGSLRLIVQTPIIPAKFAEVKAETGKLIDALVQGSKVPAGGSPFLRRVEGQGKISTPQQRIARSKGTSLR
jgi:hypothetical protein